MLRSSAPASRFCCRRLRDWNRTFLATFFSTKALGLQLSTYGLLPGGSFWQGSKEIGQLIEHGVVCSRIGTRKA